MRYRPAAAATMSGSGVRSLTPEDARRLIQQYVGHYNTVRLYSAIGFVTPADMLAGRQKEILTARDRKLEEARQRRQLLRSTGTMKNIRL